MKNKKAFTLVELLGVIILLGIVGLIVIPSITKLIRDSRQDLYENQVKMIEESARKWGIQNTDKLSTTRKTYLSLTDLINDGYIEQDTIKDPRSSEDMNGCVVIGYNVVSNKYKYLYDNRPCSEAYDIVNLMPGDAEYACYTFDEATGTILSYNKSNSACPKDVIIPNSIDGVTVTTIGKAAFYSPTEQWCYRSEPLGIGFGSFVFGSMFGSEGDLDFTEAEYMQAMMNMENYMTNNDIYDIMYEKIYNQFPVSYAHTEADGYDGCYYYGNANNYKVESVILSPSIETIEDYAFMSNSITDLDLSNATLLQNIGEFAFSDNNIASLNFGELTNLTTLESGAFSHNELTSVNLSTLTNLTSLGKIDAARHLSTSYDVNLTQYFGDMFDGEEGGFFGGDTPMAFRHDTNEGSGVFEDNNLTSITFGNLTGLTTLGDYTFTSNNLTTINLSSLTNLNIIGRNVFANNQITSINLNGLSNLVEIKNGAFAFNELSTVDLTQLTSLTDLGVSPKKYYPFTLLFSMMIAEGMPDSEAPLGGEFPYVPHFNYGIFENNYISDIDLPTESLEEIGYAAFANNHIQSLDFSSMTNLDTIDSLAFVLNDISSVNFTGLNSLIKLGSLSFGYNFIETLDLSSLTGLQKIGAGAFGMNTISSLNLQGLTNLTRIGGSAFSANNLSTLNLSGLSNLQSIGSDSFYENALTSVNFTGLTSLTTIEEDAFEENMLTSLNFSGLTNLTIIDDYAFEENQLTSLDLSPLTSLTEIGENAFSYNVITTLNMTGLNNLMTIGYNSFMYNRLSTVTIPASVTTIESGAFTQDAAYPWSSVTIGSNATNLATRFNTNWTNIGWPSNLMPS